MTDSSKIKIVRLERGAKYQRLFRGDFGTCGIKSGHVVLKKGGEIGEHSTAGLEEVLIVLKGKGTLVINNIDGLDFEKDSVLYIPPHTNHNVKNTGRGELEYIFITSNAEQKI
jgi:mannose-6-phosphate isomerase-like protein (cupin superfamily)